MNFPHAAYFTLFVDSSTENQLNILFVCMVVDDINYLRKFIVLNNKEHWILTWAAQPEGVGDNVPHF